MSLLSVMINLDNTTKRTSTILHIIRLILKKGRYGRYIGMIIILSLTYVYVIYTLTHVIFVGKSFSFTIT